MTPHEKTSQKVFFDVVGKISELFAPKSQLRLTDNPGWSSRFGMSVRLLIRGSTANVMKEVE